mmetsp:Transcript_25896/g.59793  ORF Transcript_25896/g.59793 Transcript_25896/m.59793 type:complete len:376 (-) Transcript_25896:46-1173(-)
MTVRSKVTPYRGYFCIVCVVACSEALPKVSAAAHGSTLSGLSGDEPEALNLLQHQAWGLAREKQVEVPEQAALADGLDMAHCEVLFKRCWNPADQVWQTGSADCSDSASLCQSHLCQNGLDQKACAVDASVCLQLSTMCLQSGSALKEADEIKGQANLVFLHIPKNAGNTVERVGLEHGYQWGIHMRREKLLHPYCMWHHTPPEVLADPFVYEHSDANFCIIRHPYERAVSEYKYLLKVKWSWTPLSSMGEVYAHQPCTHEGLNHFVQTTLRIQQQQDPFLNDCHVLPQVSYIYGRERQWCTEILNVSRLADDFNALMKRYGLKAHMSGHERENSNDECNITSASLYPETLTMLDGAYALDFKLLGFTRGLASTI